MCHVFFCVKGKWETKCKKDLFGIELKQFRLLLLKKKIQDDWQSSPKKTLSLCSVPQRENAL